MPLPDKHSIRPVHLQNRQRRLRLNLNAVRSLAGLVLDAESVPPGLGITIVFVRDSLIREYNRRYLDHDFPTDVISFQPDPSDSLPADEPSAGDIMISVDHAIAYAAGNGLPAAEELARYIVHGILHCRGYDDLLPALERRMRRRQELLLQRWLKTGMPVAESYVTG